MTDPKLTLTSAQYRDGWRTEHCHRIWKITHSADKILNSDEHYRLKSNVFHIFIKATLFSFKIVNICKKNHYSLLLYQSESKFCQTINL